MHCILRYIAYAACKFYREYVDFSKMLKSNPSSTDNRINRDRQKECSRARVKRIYSAAVAAAGLLPYGSDKVSSIKHSPSGQQMFALRTGALIGITGTSCIIMGKIYNFNTLFFFFYTGPRQVILTSVASSPWPSARAYDVHWFRTTVHRNSINNGRT